MALRFLRAAQASLTGLCLRVQLGEWVTRSEIVAYLGLIGVSREAVTNYLRDRCTAKLAHERQLRAFMDEWVSYVARRGNQP